MKVLQYSRQKGFKRKALEHSIPVQSNSDVDFFSPIMTISNVSMQNVDTIDDFALSSTDKTEFKDMALPNVYYTIQLDPMKARS